MNGLFIRSAEDKQKLEMIYLASNERLSQRVIRVLSVKKDDILAYCYSRNQLRTFKKENVMSVYPYKREVGT
ncbi:hypothetical protein [Halobacillus seohaensis]|uniref:WYL domain-containing protein n=1 Tax=Halobacillus seohaensis TaxID=447421 RepID=A0ABW2EQV9_9BACI